MGRWENIKRLITNEPPPHIFKRGVPVGQDTFGVGKKIAEYLQCEDDRAIFVIGPWGSGKSTQVQSAISNLRGTYLFSTRSFFSVKDLNTAYLHLLSFRSRLITYSVFGLTVIAVYVGGPHLSDSFRDYVPDFVFSDEFRNAWLVVLGLFVFVFLTNKMRLYYSVSSFVGSLLPFRKRKVVVLEDLDRSSLSTTDLWALLSNLWTWNTSYIVLLGYHDDSKKEDILEQAVKLEGRIISLGVEPSINLAIIASQDKEGVPFEGKCEWLEVFTPRELINVQQSVKENYGDDLAERRIGYVQKMFRALLDKRRIRPEEFRSLQVNQNLTISLGRPSPRGEHFDTQTHMYFNAFCNSVNVELRGKISAVDPNSLRAFLLGNDVPLAATAFSAIKKMYEDHLTNLQKSQLQAVSVATN